VIAQGLGGLGHLGVQYARAMGFEVHGIRPMIGTFPLAEAARAVESMMKGTVRFRAVLDVAGA
jgi:D-arabinose 1-dehydrogenase-like Zn-dependent alcohol dehydrogenase